MAHEELHPAFRFLPPHHIGDPAVMLESILAQVEAGQRKQIIGLYMDSVVATLEANIKFAQGVRSAITSAK